MRHRVEAAGGRLTVDAAPGRGTRVMAVLPTRTIRA
jgi:signal transduction histidine kinase